MKYEPRLPREGINVPETHPLSELVQLVLGVTVLATALFFGLSWLAQLAAPWVPPRVEQAVFSRLGDGIATTLGEPLAASDGARLEALLGRLTEGWPENPYAFQLRQRRDHQINAFAIPGGYIVLTRGLLEATADDDRELAFVLGHELGHFHNRDHLRSLGRTLSLELVRGVLGAGSGETAAGLLSHLEAATNRRFDRAQELAADRFALGLLTAEFGDVAGCTAFFARVEGPEGRSSRWLDYLRSHPAVAERVAQARELVAANRWRTSPQATPP